MVVYISVVCVIRGIYSGLDTIVCRSCVFHELVTGSRHDRTSVVCLPRIIYVVLDVNRT